MTPAFMNYSRHPTPPKSLKRREENALVQDLPAEAIEDWRKRMEALVSVWQKAIGNAIKAQDSQEKYFDQKHRDVQYEVGDQVMPVKRVLSSAPQGICAGFTPPFSGPYTVSKKLGTNVYELIDEEGDIVPRVPNDELKPAFLDE